MMQERRLKQRPPAFGPDGSRVSVAAEFWDELQHKDITSLCNLTLFEPFSSHQILFRFLNEDVLVDIEHRCLKRRPEQQWQQTADPLLELVTVLYLLNVKDIYPVGNKEQLASVQNIVLEDQVVDWILEQIEVNDEQTTFAALTSEG